MSLKELRGQGWKIGLYSALLIFWVTLIAAPFFTVELKVTTQKTQFCASLPAPNILSH